MYGLPKDFDGTFLVDRCLELVCFSENQVFLHFDQDITITIEAAFTHQTSRVAANPLPITVPASESRLMTLLGHAVASVASDSNGTLILIFDSGHVVKCYDTSHNYESYRIKRSDTLIVV